MEGPGRVVGQQARLPSVLSGHQVTAWVWQPRSRPSSTSPFHLSFPRSLCCKVGVVTRTLSSQYSHTLLRRPVWLGAVLPVAGTCVATITPTVLPGHGGAAQHPASPSGHTPSCWPPRVTPVDKSWPYSSSSLMGKEEHIWAWEARSAGRWGPGETERGERCSRGSADSSVHCWIVLGTLGGGSLLSRPPPTENPQWPVRPMGAGDRGGASALRPCCAGLGQAGVPEMVFFSCPFFSIPSKSGCLGWGPQNLSLEICFAPEARVFYTIKPRPINEEENAEKYLGDCPWAQAQMPDLCGFLSTRTPPTSAQRPRQTGEALGCPVGRMSSHLAGHTRLKESSYLPSGTAWWSQHSG